MMLTPLLAVAWVYASQWLAGELVVRALWRRGSAARLCRLEHLGAALLLGPAALAAQMLLMSLVSIPFTLATVLAPWWLAAAATALHRRARRSLGPGLATSASPTVAHASSGSRASAVTAASLTALALLLFGLVVWIGLRTPVFDSDPMNNYAFAARWFETHRSLAGPEMAELRAVGHIEYPPLVALNEALVFMAAGEQRLRAVMPFFALPWLALQLLVIAAARRRLRPAWAVPVCLIVMLTPEPFALGTVGLGDLRLAASVLLLALQGSALLARPDGAAALRFAAIAVACALTKNEGVVVAGLASLPLLGLALRRRLPARAASGALALLLVGSTLWIALLHAWGVPTGYWKDEAVGALSPDIAARALAALDGFRGFAFGSGLSSFFGVLWLAGALAAALGLARRAAHRETAALLAALAAQLLLYALLLAVVAQPMAWSLQASGLRLFTHLLAWPILLLVAALARPREPVG